MRLSATGRDQARAAGDWLRRNGLATFDRSSAVQQSIKLGETCAVEPLVGYGGVAAPAITADLPDVVAALVKRAEG